jgi:bacterioferritin (cytochrome b1)
VKGSPELEPLLNGCLKEHLYAKDYYRLSKAVFKVRGYPGMAEELADIKEVHDCAARNLLNRILRLQLDPDITHEFPDVERDLQLCLTNSLAMESRMLADTADAVATTREIPDVKTHELLEAIGCDLDCNVKWFEDQLKRLSDMGQQIYLETKV